MAHSLADTLITPLNDSFIDFDLLAHVDADGTQIQGPSVYSEMVWSARQLRAQAGLKPIDWIVLRNRLGAQNMVNKKKMEKALERLAKRIGFRIAPGFSERVVFRELFPRGLTLLDLKDVGVKQLNISNVAARQELRDLVKALEPAWRQRQLLTASRPRSASSTSTRRRLSRSLRAMPFVMLASWSCAASSRVS